jgi:hypothetical protein
MLCRYGSLAAFRSHKGVTPHDVLCVGHTYWKMRNLIGMRSRTTAKETNADGPSQP